MGKNVISLSFGKDSLAAAIVAYKAGMRNLSGVYCKVMFDSDTSAEMPEHDEFIRDVAMPKLRLDYGIETEVLIPKMTVVEMFYRERKRGKNVGKIYGWPSIKGCWVSSNIKLPEIRKWKQDNPGITEIVGIASDETERAERKIVEGKRLILCEQGITERDALELVHDAGLLSPIYSYDRQRSGCWFCPEQRMSQLCELRQKYPAMWETMLKLDADSPYSFKPRYTVKQLESKFRVEEEEKKFWERLKVEG